MTDRAPSPRSRFITYSLAASSMIAFAANSVLCRLALRAAEIDAATFTAVRLVAGALALLLVVSRRRWGGGPVAGSWASASALFVYAATFSFAYVALTTGTGALLLFGSVQVTMIGYGLWRGERFPGWAAAGFAAALGGLVYLLLPGLTSPPLGPAALMTAAGVAWGGVLAAGQRLARPRGRHGRKLFADGALGSRAGRGGVARRCR